MFVYQQIFPNSSNGIQKIIHTHSHNLTEHYFYVTKIQCNIILTIILSVIEYLKNKNQNKKKKQKIQGRS